MYKVLRLCGSSPYVYENREFIIIVLKSYTFKNNVKYRIYIKY